ncbi:MAG TPA: hypothetical protein VGG44_02485, partial [Tepidisphaeraceae bacterium]
MLCWGCSTLAFLYLIFHLLQLINKYSVNLLFQDNFNYYFLLSGHWNFWQRFDVQLGPHREGMGLILSSVIAPATRWNMKAEAIGIGVILILAAIFCLWLKKRAFGRIDWYDLIILPCFFLSPRQYQIWCMTVNSSHGALPLLLVILYCLSWTIADRRRRDACVLIVNFMAVFTGFGLFLGIITCVAFAVMRNKIAVSISLATWVLFFFNYTFDPANPDFAFFDPAIVGMPHAIAIGLAHAANIVDGPLDQICGYFMLAAMAVALAAHWQRFVKGNMQSVVIVSLIGFTLLFVVATVEGRISFGEDCLTASRYVPLIVPGFVGVYLSIATFRNSSARAVLIFIALVIAVNMSLNTRQDDLHMMDQFRAMKLAWISKYRSTGDINKADHGGFMPIYPHPQPRDIR